MSALVLQKTFNEALYKAFEGAGIRLPKYKKMIMTIRENEQGRGSGYCPQICKCRLSDLCYQGNSKNFKCAWSKGFEIRKLEQESPNILDLVLGHQIDLIIDIPAQGAERSHDGFVIRRNAIETGVNVLTALDTARAPGNKP